MIPREKLVNRPELLKLVDESISYRWIGPGGHIMVYPIRNHQLFNMVLLHPDRRDTEESWTATGPKSNMLEFYSGWSPTVRALLDLVDGDQIPEWRLKIHKPLASWVEGNVALMGDACHPTLPYVAQGAAQAAEDAGVLAAVLSLINDKADIYTALLIYSVSYVFIYNSPALIRSSRPCVKLVARRLWRVRTRLGRHFTSQMVQNKFQGMTQSARRLEGNAKARICGVICPSKHGYGELTSSSKLLTALNNFIVKSVSELSQLTV
jgi:2-polyprenyl-6-methoxyphenol hydroxylase-like FAD-dependent oxidoreductase